MLRQAAPGLIGAIVVAGAVGVPAQAAAPDVKPLTRMSVEELAQIQVVTVTGRPETILEAAGAVHVITSEDIRRTGAATLPDALQTAPGVQVSRIDADEWALAIRGFASRLSRSVLVMMDGRSLWTPLFAGVFWDAQDTLLDDIDQIEVSRGPGGALYGANALNGVISVTTRHARDTHGGLATLAAGNTQRQAGLRWGGHKGADLHYRVFGKYALRDGTEPTSAAGYDDEWTHAVGGLRLDWNRGEKDSFTLLGDLYNGSSAQPATVAIFTPPFSQALSGDAAFRGRSAVTRWTRRLAGGGDVVTQAYFDRTTRREPYYGEARDTFDIDVRHRFRPGGRHDVVWGANYRRSAGRFDGVPTLQMTPAERTDDIAGVFANDEVRTLRERLRITVGTKLEWNDYSGWNVQPSGRLAWVTGRHAFWGSVARAVRTSSRLERDITVYSSLSPTLPLFAKATGSDDFVPESVLALETGYSLRLARVIVSASVFRNRYRDLASNEPGPPFLEPGSGAEPTRSIIPVAITNGPGGTARGLEAKVVFSPLRTWRLQGTYSLLDLDAGAAPDGNTPRHQFWLTSYFTPVDRVDVDVVFRAIGPVPGHRIPSRTDLDSRIAYRPRLNVELAVAGTNLLHPQRAEFGGGFAIQRSGRVQATVRF